MRLTLRILAVGILVILGWTISRCGTVTISNLNPTNFVTPTPTP